MVGTGSVEWVVHDITPLEYEDDAAGLRVWVFFFDTASETPTHTRECERMPYDEFVKEYSALASQTSVS